MTAAVVLAAGVGRRLAGVTAAPKWRLPVRDAPPSCPAQCQLEALSANTVDGLYVVVGDDVAPIDEATQRWGSSLRTTLVPNEHSRSRNNWYSLLLGLERCRSDGSDDIVALNSDLYASTPWMTEAVGRTLRCDAPAGLVVDPERGRTDEAMKVSIGDSGEQVSAIGKIGVDDPRGEYVGIAWWTAAAADGLIDILRGFVHDERRTDHWYEHGIDDHLRAGGRYASIPTPDSGWVEIDDADDLDAARRLVV